MQDLALAKVLDIQYPIIVAPMFLVSNEAMLIAACEFGATAAVPSLNYRTPEELRKALRRVRSATNKAFGVNLIVNKSNIHMQEHLKICLEEGVDYFITSLGNPKQVIEESHKQGVKVFCDVVDEKYAKKVVDLGCDGLVAVNSGAGGHAGSIPVTVLVPMLKEKFPGVPVISAGGIANGKALLAVEVLGADGFQIGTPFIATKEAPVSEEYKKAIIDYHAEDVVMTSKLSGTPCTVIATDYVKKIGTEQNPIEKFLNENRQLKKYAKMLTHYKGMKLLENAAFQASYKSVWCAGPSLEFSKEISSVKDILQSLVHSYEEEKNSRFSRPAKL
tara:strand:+ start:20756 stop:21751 length:996 start_codon:yes stop_codon:yes gene_type:complete